LVKRREVWLPVQNRKNTGEEVGRKMYKQQKKRKDSDSIRDDWGHLVKGVLVLISLNRA